MKALKSNLPRAAAIFAIFTLICGVAYTAAVTALAQFLFPKQANGSIIEADGKRYGSELLGQSYTDDAHMWGRVMNIDVSTYQGTDGRMLLYAVPSNLTPASEDYARLISERVEKIRQSNPDMGSTPVPVDLVTGSGSGLDPHISPAAAEYQVPRLTRSTGKSEEEIREIIRQCTGARPLGLFGEPTVNVLKVNLKLDGILE